MKLLVKLYVLRWRVAWLALLASGTTQALELQAFSEDLPPFAYEDHGVHRGMANEVLDRISKRAGFSVNRQNMPWARSLREAQAEPNSVLYVTVRTPEREAQYLWVGPLDACDIVLMKLRRRSELKFDPATMPESTQIGVGRGSPSMQLLKDAGVAEHMIYPTPRSEISVRMLFAARLDMMAGLYLPSLFQAQRNGYQVADLQAFHTLKPGYGCYFAFNPKIDTQLLAQFRKGFAELQSSGELESLREQYLRDPERIRR